MLRYFNLILILLLGLTSFPQNNIIRNTKNYISKDFTELLFISIENQKMYHIKNNNIISKYIISSSAYGTGNKAGSNKTPLGLHKVKEKYGKATPINGRMTGRVFYGDIATIYADETKSKTDDITSRILWLTGLEPGVNMGGNVDSNKRFIYIHGTHEEGLIGIKASHGCIRMFNQDVLELYEIVSPKTPVNLYL